MNKGNRKNPYDKEGIFLYESLEQMGNVLAAEFGEKIDESITYDPPPENLGCKQKYYPLSVRERAEFESAALRYLKANQGFEETLSKV